MYKLPKPIRWLFLVSLSFILTFYHPTIAVAQFPFLLPSTTNSDDSQTVLWNLNRAHPCGKFWCSEIYLYKDQNVSEPDLILGIARNQDQSFEEAESQIKERSKLVRRTIDEIAENIVEWNTIPAAAEQPIGLFWLNSNSKPLHPLTPKIEVGIENEQTVIYTPSQPSLGLANQAIVTVTEVDATVNGTTVKKLAQQWQNTLRLTYSSFLWGQELDRQYPLLRPILAGIIILITVFLIWLLNIIGKPLKRWQYRLKGKSDQITRSLAQNPESLSSQGSKNVSLTVDNINKNSTGIDIELNSANPSDFEKSNPIQRQFFLFLFQQVLRLNLALSRGLSEVQPIFKQQILLEQKRNLSKLFLSLIFLLQCFLIFIGLGLIALTFRETRFLLNTFFQEAQLIPLIWVGASIINKVLDFVIDDWLDNWATEGQKIDPNSNRYGLRVNTYSKAFKGAKNVLLVAIAVYLTILLIGINPSVLAGAGAFAVIVAFLSRNVLEDMLNGALILWTDRYAIGDVIIVPDIGDGAVEDMNLYTTSLRNIDGELTVIPNGKISAVRNLSKNWAQVNFAIRVAWDTNIKTTMNTLQEVLDQLQSKAEWQEKILEPGQILGIDEVSHEGILIRIIIKTQPLQQWAVGREFRLRLKEAFAQAGIALGIPQREIAIVQNHETLSNGKNA